ncbi:MAG: hypothetical protein ACXWJM_10680 [Ramlibacter sp.]
MAALSRLASASRYAAVVLAAVVMSNAIAIAAAPNPVKARKHSRCEQCGVIQTIRRIDAADGRPPTYEITIRLHDGSMRTHSNATPGNWRAGDRIMLIKGGRPANEPTV